MLQLVENKQVESGNFQNGGFKKIKSRHRLFKDKYVAITDVKNGGASGFGWDESKQQVVADDDVFRTWTKRFPGAKGLNKKPFPYYDQLARIFGKRVLESMINQGIDGRNMAATSKTSASTGTSKRPRKEVVASGMTDEIAKLHPLLEKTASSIERMVNSICHDDDIQFRRGNLYSELAAMDGLSHDQVVAASLALMKDDQAAQLFYQLPTEEDKFSFVLSIIN
ncbi:hypothetical protein LINPERHAP2_LOCUS33429 [Linum perenne]